ncbi:hypothetical protein [Pseudonocardia pini]|uniref:hypothetical protein n=1 Tax=Pseudonocardia pini TaxID=2758030 RepID=UPI0015F09E28|nr:hypothetical protein [Pseudonocardia pini]
MSQTYPFTVRPDDGDPYQVTADLRDVVAWEDAKPGRKVVDLMKNDYTARDVYELARLAAKRDGREVGSVKDFMRTAVVDLGHTLPKADADGDVDDLAESADPTRPAP